VAFSDLSAFINITPKSNYSVEQNSGEEFKGMMYQLETAGVRLQ
jgi:hypothetical protein